MTPKLCDVEAGIPFANWSRFGIRGYDIESGRPICSVNNPGTMRVSEVMATCKCDVLYQKALSCVGMLFILLEILAVVRRRGDQPFRVTM